MSILPLIFAILLIFTLYGVYANHVYSRVLPQSRPCIDCPSPVHINGYDLFYRELGTNKGLPPIILIHGGPGHSCLSFKNSFDFLASQTRLILYDQRGSGNSQIKPIPADYTIEQLVEELETLRQQVVQAHKIILIGHSFGSALAQRYALKYPHHVEKMILIGGIRINNGLSNRFIWRWFGGALYAIALGLPPADPQAADAWFTQSAEKDNPKRLFDKSRPDLLHDSGRLSFAPWREISLSLVGYNYKQELNQLMTPTLFIYGTADSPFTGQPAAAELCATLPNCQANPFTQSGHWPFLEEPEKFQQTVNDYVGLTIK